MRHLIALVVILSAGAVGWYGIEEFARMTGVVLLAALGSAVVLWLFFGVAYPNIVAAGYRAAQRDAVDSNKFDHKEFMDEEKECGVEINHKRVVDAFRYDSENK